MEVKGLASREPAQRTARTLPGEPSHRTPLARLPFSQGQAAVRMAPPTTIKTKTRDVM